MTSWPPLSDLPPGMSATLAAVHEQGFPKPFVEDDGQFRSLHFTRTELQSRMDTRKPWLLEVDYTRTMMGFLLFQPAPSRIAMVGLGGGSLAKFCYRQLPASNMLVIENNPHVIALRREFGIPDDDDRFRVAEADGAAFMAAQTGAFDVLLIDGFDDNGQPPALCSQRFYDDCFAALRPGGLMAVNLHQDDAAYAVWTERVLRSFGGNVVEVPAPEKSNCIVFASRGLPISPRRMNVQASLKSLESAARTQLKAELARVAWCMKDLEA